MNRELFRKIIRSYSQFLAKNPFIILIIALMVTVYASQLQSGLKIEPQNNKDFLPSDRPVVAAFEKIGDEFGGLNTITIAIEVDPQIAGSNEVRDILDPRMIEYGLKIHKKLEKIDEIASVNSGSELLKKGNNGTRPNSIKRGLELWKNNPVLDQYLSKDHTIMLIKGEYIADVDRQDFYEKVDSVVIETTAPPGTRTFITGELAQDVQMDTLVGPDMQRVMSLTMFGIMGVVFIVMGSIAFGILPLFTIIFGTIWSMGLWAGLGNNLTFATSGVSSMIMGIGIDFGIQTITRFRQEFEKISNPEEAITETLLNVILPMSTTTISALIGFRAMSMGELSFMGEMGAIMSYGVLGCMLAAVTVVPAIIVIYMKYIRTIKIREVFK